MYFYLVRCKILFLVKHFLLFRGKRARSLDHVGSLLAGEMVEYSLYQVQQVFLLMDKPGLLQIDAIVFRWWHFLLVVFSFLLEQVREYSLLMGIFCIKVLNIFLISFLQFYLFFLTSHIHLKSHPSSHATGLKCSFLPCFISNNIS